MLKMKIIRLDSILFIFLSIALSGCAALMPARYGPKLIYQSAPQRPEWITKLSPSEDYFYAVGIETASSSLQKAKQAAAQMAVTEVADYLGVRADVRFEQKKTELTTRALKEITTASRARVKGSRMSEMYYEQYREVINGKVVTTYDVYVLLRIPYIEIRQEKERQKKELEQVLVQAKKIFNKGNKSQEEGNLSFAFQEWFIALEILEKVDPGAPIKYEIISKLKNSINRLTISFAPSEPKEIKSIEKFPVKLSLQVRFEGKKDIPLKNIPLQFYFLSGQGILDEVATTDPAGKASCNVYSIEPWPQEIMIESRLIPENILPKSTKLSPEFIQEIKKLINTKKAIYIFSADALPDTKKAFVVPSKLKESIPKLPRGKRIISVDLKTSNKYILSTERRLYLCLKIDLLGIDIANLSRPPLNISLVFDRSGSMEEEKKIDYTKEAAKFLIDNLTPNDFFSVVAYDRDIEIISPAAPVTTKNLLKHKIEHIFAGGTTNLSGGLSEGYQQVLKNRKKNFVNRIILLSDGLANVGVTDKKSLCSLAKKYRRQGVSITTLGVGTDFEEDLMVGLAEYGGGNYYFVKNPEKIPEVFQYELKQLLAVIAQNITVELYPKPGIELVNIFNSGYEPEKISGGMLFTLGDISSGERKILIIELKLPKQKKGERFVAKVKIKYDDITGGGDRVIEEKNISVIYTDDSRLVASGENQEVDKYLRISCAAQMMYKAMKTLDAGLFDETIDMLRKEYDSIIEYTARYPDPWLIEKAEMFKHCADRLVKLKESGKLRDRDAMKGLRKELHYEEYKMMMRHHK